MPTGENRKSLGPLAIAGVEPYQVKAGEEYMNDQQKVHFRKILGAWRNQLMQEVDRTVDHMKDEAANFPDPVDRAAQEEEFALELRTRDRERKLIKKIEKTLLLLEEDDFGYCEHCGIEMDGADQSIEAVLSSAQEMEAFGFDTPMPCLLIKRRSLDTEGRMIEYVEGTFRGDAYAYRVHLPS